jgi:hypothetical protein
VIVKPTGPQEEDRLHNAVGTALAAGAKVGSAGKKAGRVSARVILYYFIGVMMFGLLLSSVPTWFKAVACLGVFLLYRKTRKPKPQAGV